MGSNQSYSCWTTPQPPATPDPSHICDLHHSLWQCQILNPRSKARDRTRVLMNPSQICFHYTTMGTPPPFFFNIFEYLLSATLCAGGWRQDDGKIWTAHKLLTIFQEKKKSLSSVLICLYALSVTRSLSSWGDNQGGLWEREIFWGHFWANKGTRVC